MTIEGTLLTITIGSVLALAAAAEVARTNRHIGFRRVGRTGR
jgi:hypothetical protein